MSAKDQLLMWARRRGVYEPLKVLIEGTEKLTDWEWDVGDKANFVGYSDPQSGRRIVRYGWVVNPDRLHIDVNKRSNAFGSVFRVEQDEVFRRLKQHLPDAVEGGQDDYVEIRSREDAEQFIAFLKSFVGKGAE
jgi:hypothetical protein